MITASEATRPVSVINSISKLILILIAVNICYAAEIPDYYSEPGINPYRSYINQDFAEHIDPFTGKLQLHYVDLYLPGNGGFDIKIQRSYTSLDEVLPSVPEMSIIGMGWDMAFGLMIKSKESEGCGNSTQNTKDNPVMKLADGSLEVFAAPSQGSAVFGGSTPDYISKNRWIAYCADTSTGIQWEVYSPDGLKYELSKTISSFSNNITAVRKITDTNGNSITFDYYGDDDLYSAYNIKPFVKKISASDGRYIDFDYHDSVVAPYETMRLKSISANGSTTLYDYKQVESKLLYQLTKVDLPGTGTGSWEYSYHFDDADPLADIPGKYSIKSVTYPYGGEIRYTYDRNMYLQNDGKVTNGIKTKTTFDGAVVGQWTYSYTPGYESYLPDELDETVVTMPGSVEVYQHYGLQSSGLNKVWKIGLLKKKMTCNIGVACTESTATQTETYTWDYQTVSQEDFSGPRLLVDEDIRQPILTRKVITRDGSVYETQYSDFDNYGNARQVTESGNDSKTTLYSFYRNSANWIVNQVEDVTVLDAAEIDGSLVNATIDRTLDSKGNLTSENNYGVTTAYTFYANGDLETKTNARIKTTTFSDYYRGVARKEDRPEEVTIKRTVNSTGTLESETNGRDKKTGFTYDSLNRLVSIDYPINSDVSVVRTTTSKTLTRGNYREIVNYDGFGRSINVKKSDAVLGTEVTTSTRYDALGRKIFESYPNSSVEGTSYGYDALGRLELVTNIDGSTIEYDYLSSNRTKIKNERTYYTVKQFRSYGDPDKAELVRTESTIGTPEEVITTIQRDKLGNVTQIWQGNSAGVGSSREYKYNNKFFVVQETNPETGVTYYGRDEVGNMTSRQVGTNGPVTKYFYDDLDRHELTDYPAPTPDVSYLYDKNNNITETSNQVSKRVSTYDENDNQTQEDIIIAGSLYTLKYSYDTHDNLGAVTYPTGRVANYSPDALGRPTKVGPHITSVTYYPSGQPHVLTYNNDQTVEYALNNRRWIESIQSSGPSASPAIGLVYGYDHAGNVETITNTNDSTYSRVMTYDGLNRLDVATGQWGIEDYSYTETGDIKAISSGVTSKIFDYSNNRLDTVTLDGTVTSYSYDNYGNVDDNGSYIFYYNDAQNLTLATPKSAGATFVFDYDGNNMRVIRDMDGQRKKSVYASSGLLMGEYVNDIIKAEEHFYLGTQRIASATVQNRMEASAGPDMTVNEGETVNLDAGASTLNGLSIDSYTWEQIAGPKVTLAGYNTVKAAFTAPTGYPDYQLLFRLTIHNNEYGISDTDTVVVNVNMIDTDGDSLSDLWETDLYGGVSVVGANDDTDGDGLTTLEEFELETDPTAQNTPEVSERLRAVPGNGESVITWMESDYATAYDIYWSESPGVTAQNGTKIENVTSAYTHSGLTNGKKYYYILAARNGCCESYSTEVSVVPGLSGWTTPSVITATSKINSGGYVDKEFMAIWDLDGTYGSGGDEQGRIGVESYGQYEGWRRSTILQVDGEADAGDKPDISMGKDGSAIALWKLEGTLTARHYSKSTGWANQYSWTLGDGQSYIYDRVYVVTQSNGEATILVSVFNPVSVKVSVYAIDYNPQSEWSDAQLVHEYLGNFPEIYDVIMSENGHLAFFFNEGMVNQVGGKNLRLLKRDTTKNWSVAIDVSGNAEMGQGYATINNSGNVAVAYKKTVFNDSGYVNRLFIWRDDVQTSQSLNEILSENEIFDASVTSEGLEHAQVRSVMDDSGRITVAWSPLLSFSLDGSTGECFAHPEVAHRIYYKQFVPTAGWSEQKQIEVNIPSNLNCSSLQENFALTQDGNGVVHLIANANAAETQPGDILALGGTQHKAVLDYRLKYDEGNRYPIEIYPWYLTGHMGQFGIDNDPSPIAYSDNSGNILAVIRENIATWTSDHPAVAEYVNITGSPLANAGVNHMVYPLETVMLDGSQSASPTTGISSYAWVQLSGQPVALNDVSTATPTFQSPEITSKETLWFELTVTDTNGLSGRDTVAVTVYPATSDLVANVGADEIVIEGSTVTLDGSSTLDPNGIIQKAHWVQTTLPLVELNYPTNQTSEYIQWNATFVAPEVDEDTVLTFKLRIEDSAGRVIYAYKNITVRNDTGSTDVTPPVVTPPADMDLEATAVLTPVSLGSATATDETDGAIAPQADQTGPFALGTHVITWSATDASGNKGTAQQTVVIRDTTPPNLVAPGAISVHSNVPLTVDIGLATASDIFEPVTIGNDAPVQFPIGVTLVTWTATDQNGNTATAQQSVSVIAPDVTPPAVTPPSSITAEATAVNTPVNLGVATAVDDVDGSITPQPDITGPFTLGSHTITWSATDSAGNTGTATQTVEITDTTPPTLTVPDDVSVESDIPIAVDIGTATADDIFTPVLIENDAPSEFPLGETIVNWKATDANGNVTTATQRVEVTVPDFITSLIEALIELWNYLKSLFG